MAIKRFKNFETDKFKNLEPTNEFFGSMLKDFLKNAKNKMSLKISKKIGGAKNVDKAVEEYKKKIQPFIDKELENEKEIIDKKEKNFNRPKNRKYAIVRKKKPQKEKT